MANSAIIDLSIIEDRNMFYKVLKGLLVIPHDCGNNLDALHDVLSTTSLDIRFTNVSEANEEISKYFERVKLVLSDSADENPHLHYEIEEQPHVEDTSTHD